MSSVSQGKPMIRTALLMLLIATGFHGGPVRAENDYQAPRVQAALAQGRAAELGIGMPKNRSLALALYCHAGTMGSPEGFFRVGRLLATDDSHLRDPGLANTYLTLAIRLGKHQALRFYDANVPGTALGSPCGTFAGGAQKLPFDVDGYLAQQPAAKQKIAELIRVMAPQYQVDPRLALAIALAESNLDAGAVSDTRAQGVMQLMPATQRRFGVTNPLDPEQNVRAALAYLSSLNKRFAGDWSRIAIAYEAGETRVKHCSSTPPCLETQQYVGRVLHFAGFVAGESVAPGRPEPDAPPTLAKLSEGLVVQYVGMR